jgi:hypothetical protein
LQSDSIIIRSAWGSAFCSAWYIAIQCEWYGNAWGALLQNGQSWFGQLFGLRGGTSMRAGGSLASTYTSLSSAYTHTVQSLRTEHKSLPFIYEEMTEGARPSWYEEVQAHI